MPKDIENFELAGVQGYKVGAIHFDSRIVLYHIFCILGSHRGY